MSETPTPDGAAPDVPAPNKAIDAPAEMTPVDPQADGAPPDASDSSDAPATDESVVDPIDLTPPEAPTDESTPDPATPAEDPHEPDEVSADKREPDAGASEFPASDETTEAPEIAEAPETIDTTPESVAEEAPVTESASDLISEEPDGTPADTDLEESAVDPPTVDPPADAEPAPAPVDADPAATLSSGGPMMLTPEQVAAMMADDAGDDDGSNDAEDWGTVPLTLDTAQMELVQFLAIELSESATKLDELAERMAALSSRKDACESLREMTDGLMRTADHFGFPSLKQLLETLASVAVRALAVQDGAIPDLTVRVRAAEALIEQLASGLRVGMETRWPLNRFAERIETLLNGETMHPVLTAWHRNDPDRVLELDGVVETFEELPDLDRLDEIAAEAAASGSTDDGPHGSAATHESHDATIDITHPELSGVIDATRQLVVAKNMLRLATQTMLEMSQSAPEETRQKLNRCTAEVDRLTRTLQQAVQIMRTAPIGNTIEGFGTLVTDLSRINDREVVVNTIGGSIPIDRFDTQLFAEALLQILRYSATTSIETTDERATADKPEQGTIQVAVHSEGSRIRFTITDDGKGLPEAILELDPRNEDHPLKLAADSLEAMGVSISCGAADDGGLCVSFAVPVRGAVVDAMVIDIGGARYAVPLSAIREIVRVDDHGLHTCGGEPALRVREEIFSVIDLPAILAGEPDSSPAVALLMGENDALAAALVTTVLGQQELVLEHIEDGLAHCDLVASACLGDNGQVWLVLDPTALLDRARLAAIARREAPDDPPGPGTPGDPTDAETDAVAELPEDDSAEREAA
ncbi:MAG: chemotaxis protein CheW [Planctomycetota bacterium]